MRTTRSASTARRERSTRRRTPVLAAVTLAAVLALTATACGQGGDGAGSLPDVSGSDPFDGEIKIPDELKDSLKEHGIDLDKWKDGDWKNWDEDQWLREAQDFINPIIDGLWDADRMRDAEETPDKSMTEQDISPDAGVTDPEPRPVTAQPVTSPYADYVPEAGKLFFDGPEGSMVCSATVVQDPAHPGKSNMVWTAGHCVHAGKDGGWFRNIAFVPSYNNAGLSGTELAGVPRDDLAPYGVWWADWAQTSDQWIAQGGPTGGQGAPFDFAVLHVTPEGDGGQSLEETVGSALPVDFDAPTASSIGTVTAIGYPAAPPFDGQQLFQCQGKPGRLSLDAAAPTMFRVGCTMTGGASGGGWIATGQDGRPALVSNTSIGPVTAGWLAGPHLGDVAKGLYDGVIAKFSDG